MNKQAFLVIDTETTGLDPNKNGLIEVCMQLYEGTKKVSEFIANIKQPDTVVDLGALRVNKIAATMVSIRGDSEKIAIGGLVDWLLTANQKYSDIIVVGKNVNFDLDFIKSAMERNNYTNPSAILSHRILDLTSVALFFKTLGLFNINKIGLKDLADSLEIKYNPSTLHTAVNDVELTVAVFNKLMEKAKALATIPYSGFTNQNLTDLTKDPLVSDHSSALAGLTKEPIMP